MCLSLYIYMMYNWQIRMGDSRKSFRRSSTWWYLSWVLKDEWFGQTDQDGSHFSLRKSFRDMNEAFCIQ